MRSFSGGSGSSAFRSSSGSGDRSSFSRSFGSSDRTFRTFGGGNNVSGVSGNSDRSIRSFSGGSQTSRSIGGNSSNASRILGNTNSGNSSNSQRRFQSPDVGGGRSFSGFASGNRGGSANSGQSSVGTFRNGTGQGRFRQNDGRSNVDQAQLSEFLDSRGNNRSSRLGNNSSQGGNNQLSGKPFADARRLNSSSNQSDRGRSFQGRRATGDDVRRFLDLRGDDNARLANNSNGSGGNNIAGNNNSDGGPGGRGNIAGRFDNRNADAGRDFRKLGDRSASNNNRLKLNDGLNGDGKGFGDKGKGRDGGPNFANRDNDGNRWNGGREWDGKGRDGKGFGGGKEFRGKDDFKRDFDKWSNTWKGKHGDGRDHRDWSGKWRDGHRFEVAHHVRNHWWGRRDFDRFPFRSGWWGRGYGWSFWDDCAFRYNRPFYWWGWTTCPILTSWCDFGWSTPYYWDYGYGEYIYCNNGVVYVNGAWYQPAPVFYAQTLKVIDAAPVITPEIAPQVEWLPLGVFAVTPDGLNEADLMAQLAVTKEGVIGGTVFDQKTGKSYAIQGTIDKNTQRAMWSFTNDQNVRVVMETSVNNLTQNESTGLVHYGPNDQRVVEIVRLQDPSGEAKPADGSAPQVPPQQVPPPAIP
jgi:hypothetical protein